MKKRYFMRTENDITTVYEYLQAEENEINTGMTYGEYIRQKENGTPIATFNSESKAERYIMDLYSTHYVREVSRNEKNK